MRSSTASLLVLALSFLALPVTAQIHLLKTEVSMGPGCVIMFDASAWPKADLGIQCGGGFSEIYFTGMPPGAIIVVSNSTYRVTLNAGDMGVAVLTGLKPGTYTVSIYSDTIPADHLLQLNPLRSFSNFMSFMDKITFNLFTFLFAIAVLASVYLRTWSMILTALAALTLHILIPQGWLIGVVLLALAVALYIIVWRRGGLL